METINKRTYIALLFFSLLIAQEHDYKHKSMNHRFNDAERWAKMFESSDRDDWQKPDQVISFMNIPEKALIADIGSATGYFPVRFAKIVTKGLVYGIDIEPDMVKFLKHRAEENNIKNLISILGKPDNPLIPQKVDFIFICNTYHHINEREKYFSKLRKMLKPEGQLVIVDFRKGDLPVGPPDKNKLSPKLVMDELAVAGYTLDRKYEKLPHQYMLIFNLKR